MAGRLARSVLLLVLFAGVTQALPPDDDLLPFEDGMVRESENLSDRTRFLLDALGRRTTILESRFGPEKNRGDLKRRIQGDRLLNQLDEYTPERLLTDFRSILHSLLMSVDEGYRRSRGSDISTALEQLGKRCGKMEKSLASMESLLPEGDRPRLADVLLLLRKATAGAEKGLKSIPSR